MNELQLELSSIIKMIDDEVRIDDDVSGGYLESPFDEIITKLYSLQEKLSEQQQSTEVSDNAETKALSIADVSNSLSDLDGKTVSVKIKVTKFKPKIVLDIDLANDC